MPVCVKPILNLSLGKLNSGIMKPFSLLLLLLPLLANAQQSKNKLTHASLNQLAEKYVRLGLAIGQYDPDFVDAYYGPESLKPAGIKQSTFPKDSFLQAAHQLSGQLSPFILAKNKSLSKRAGWINGQLLATKMRLRIFAGEPITFDEEARALFGITPPTFTEDHFRALVAQLDNVLPGTGNIKDRYQALANRFVIPKDKLDTIIKTTITETRKRTKKYYDLPALENFRLELVKAKPWSGYNWYQGNYSSLIQVNADITAYIERAIDVAAHEGYPGHHVYNTLLEKHLFHDKGWIEISMYPLFSPQSLIAEGTANYGKEVVFPGNDKIVFAKNVLLPLAAIDTTGLALYFEVLALRGKLSYVQTEVTRRMVNGTITEAEATRWLMDYNFSDEPSAKRSLSFGKKYRSYVINYSSGQDLVANYIGSKGGTASHTKKRWKLFKWLLMNEVSPSDLELKGKD
jgi:hypothetical protein